MFEVYRLVQAFDPSYAATHTIDDSFIDAMSIIPPLAEYIPKLKLELPTYAFPSATHMYDSAHTCLKNHTIRSPTYPH